MQQLHAAIPPEWRAVSTAQPQFIADHLLGVVGIPAGRAARRVVGHGTAFPNSPVHCSAYQPSRLRLPFPLSSHSYRCGRLLDCLPHHRASCSKAGVLGRRGFAPESAVARVCREAGTRVSTNVFLRDLDLVGVRDQDQRRIEVITEGLPVFHEFSRQSAQMVNLIDVAPRSMVLLWRWPDSAKKGRTRSSLGAGAAKLVVLAGEIGGRFPWKHNVHSPSHAGQHPRCPGAVAHSCQVVVDADGFSLGLPCGPGVRFLVIGWPWSTGY